MLQEYGIINDDSMIVAGQVELRSSWQKIEILDS